LLKRLIALVWELLACFCPFFRLSAVYIKTVALMCGISSVFWAKVALTARVPVYNLWSARVLSVKFALIL